MREKVGNGGLKNIRIDYLESYDQSKNLVPQRDTRYTWNWMGIVCDFFYQILVAQA